MSSKQTIKLTTGLRTKNLMTRSTSVPFIPLQKKVKEVEKAIIPPSSGLDSLIYKPDEIELL
jgi:hypothetical protein